MSYREALSVLAIVVVLCAVSNGAFAQWPGEDSATYSDSSEDWPIADTCRYRSFSTIE